MRRHDALLREEMAAEEYEVVAKRLDADDIAQAS
jgi:hypothetical protein